MCWILDGSEVLRSRSIGARRVNIPWPRHTIWHGPQCCCKEWRGWEPRDPIHKLRLDLIIGCLTWQTQSNPFGKAWSNPFKKGPDHAGQSFWPKAQPPPPNLIRKNILKSTNPAQPYDDSDVGEQFWPANPKRPDLNLTLSDSNRPDQWLGAGLRLRPPRPWPSKLHCQPLNFVQNLDGPFHQIDKKKN